MLLLELAAQSVRGFSPSVRAAIKPGYVGLKSPTELPAPLAGLVLSLCYPDGRGGDASFLAPGAKAGRAGLSIQSNDGSIWRLVRDLGGTGGLHKLNKATKQYTIVTQDAGDLSQLLRASVGFPDRVTYEHLFTFVGLQLPTRRPKQPKTPVLTPGKGQRKLQSSAFDQYSGSSGGDSTDDAEARLAQLEKELVQAKEAAELQFRMDGVQADVFKTETQLKTVAEFKAKVDAARAELERAPSPKSLGLPDDIVERVKRFGEEKKKRDDAMARLVAERQEAIDDRALSVEPLYRDRQFWGLLLVGLGLMVAGGVLEGAGRYLSLASIPAITLASLLALRFIEALQHKSRESAKGEVFTIREKKLHDEFELANFTIQMAFEKTNAATNDEFFAAMAVRDQLAPQMGELERQLAELEADAPYEKLSATIAELKAEQEELNQRLLSMSGGYVREVRDIERDLAKVKELLAPPPPPPAEEFRAVTTAVETYDDPIPAVMQLGSALFSTDLPSLWALLKDRSAQYLKALCDQRYHGIDVSADGRATLLAPGRTVLATELPGKDLDLLYLSIRLTLVEKYSAQSKLPVIIEDTFGSIIDITKQSLVGRMLKHLGSLTQVLHVIGASQNVTAADDVIQI